MASSGSPVAGQPSDAIKQPINGEDHGNAPSKRNRNTKTNNASLSVDFSGDDTLLTEIKALALVMKLDLNKYVVEAVEARFKADRERVKKEFNNKK